MLPASALISPILLSGYAADKIDTASKIERAIHAITPSDIGPLSTYVVCALAIDLATRPVTLAHYGIDGDALTEALAYVVDSALNGRPSRGAAIDRMVEGWRWQY